MLVTFLNETNEKNNPPQLSSSLTFHLQEPITGKAKSFFEEEMLLILFFTSFL